MKTLWKIAFAVLLIICAPLAARAQLTGCTGYTSTTNFGLGLPPLHVTGWGGCVQSDLSAIDQLLLNYGAGAGTAQAQTVTLSSAITSYQVGLMVRWLPVAANTGAAPTLAVNGLAAKPIVKVGGAALVANDLTTTAIAIAIYDGVSFELQDPQTGGSGGSGLGDPGANGVIKRTGLNATAVATQSDLSSAAYVAGGGTAQAQTATLSPAIAAYAAGLVVRWKPTAANTAAAPTLAVNGLSAVAIVKEPGNAALVANDLAAGVVAVAVYDGTNFELQDPQTSVGVPVEAVRTTGATLAQGDSNSVIPFNISTAQTVTVPPASNYANVKIVSEPTSTATLTVAIPSGTLTNLSNCSVASNQISVSPGGQAWVGTDNMNFWAMCALPGQSVAPNQSVYYISQNCKGQSNCTQVVGDGKIILDATTASGSATVTCPNSDCPTSSDVGKIYWVTTIGGFTNFQTFSVICAQGTITSANGSQFTGNGTNCSSTVTAAAVLHWGTDDTAALQAAWTTGTAACANGNPPVFKTPAVHMIYQAAWAINPPSSCYFSSSNGNPRGISIVGEGMGSYFDATPNFSLPSCTGPDGTGLACWGWGHYASGSWNGQGGMFVHNIYMGGPPVGGTTAFWPFYVPSDGTLDNVYCFGWGGQDTGAIGVMIGSFNAFLTNTAFDGCGGSSTAEQLSGSFVRLGPNDYFGDGLKTGWWNHGGTLYAPNGVMFGASANGNSSQTFFQDGGVTQCTGCNLYPPVTATASVLHLTGGAAYFANSEIGFGNGVNAGTTGILNAGGTLYLRDSQLNFGAGTTSLSLSSGKFYDEGGNGNFGGGTLTISNATVCNSVTLVVTVAQLCAAPGEGSSASVSDANSTTFNAAAAGSGANHLRVRYNGSGWVIY